MTGKDIAKKLENALNTAGFSKGNDKDENHYKDIIVQDDAKEINVVSVRPAFGPTFRHLENEFYNVLTSLGAKEAKLDGYDIYYVGSDAFDYTGY